MEHWPFSELKDWSFSGYSFTLVSYVPCEGVPGEVVPDVSVCGHCVP